MALGAAAVLVVAFAAGAVSIYAAGPGPDADDMAAAMSTSAAATASDGGTAYPAGDSPATYATVCGPMYGGHAAGSAGEPSPEQAANMTSRMNALYAEHDAILAEYGFVYREPANLTDAQMASIEAEMNAVMARYDGMLDKVDALAGRHSAALPGQSPFATFGPQATMSAVYQLITAEHDDILRRHGFAISTPQLSDADERRLAERLDAVMDKMNRVYEEYCAVEQPDPVGGDGADDGLVDQVHGADGVLHHGIAAAIDALYAEHDAILAEYGFVYRAPANLTVAQLDKLDDRTGRLFERHADAVEDLAGRLAPMLANGSITVADAFAKDMRLTDRTNAEHHALLAEFGYVIVVPKLSAEDREAMDKRLADVYARIDAAFEAEYQAYGGAGGGGDGGREAAGHTPASDPPAAPVPQHGNASAVADDAFGGGGQPAPQEDAEHAAPMDEYDYLTVTPEHSEGNGTLVNEGQDDIYDRIEAALEEWHATTQSPDYGGDDDDNGHAPRDEHMATQSPDYGGDDDDNGHAPRDEHMATQSPDYGGDDRYDDDNVVPIEEWYAATQSPSYDGYDGYDGGSAPHDDEDYSATYSSSDGSGDGDDAAATTGDRTS